MSSTRVAVLVLVLDVVAGLVLPSAPAGARHAVAGSVRRFPSALMADTASVASACVAATRAAASEFAITPGGGNSGDPHGRDGIEPVLKAALDAASADAALVLEVQKAADAAIARTNANAERVADAIIVACMACGADKPDSLEYSGAYRVAMGKQK